MSRRLHCPFPSTVSPHAEQLQRESVEWAVAHGLVATPAASARLARSGVGWLVARAVADGALEPLRLAADWTTLFCLLDDRVEELPPLAASELLASLFREFQAATEPTSRTTTEPFALALADLRRRMEASCPRAWIEHFEALVEDLFTTFLLETIHRAQDRCPDLETYRAMREISVGLRPEFALAELACGVELSAEQRNHPLVVALTAAAARSAGWANDLFTSVREMGAGELHNLVVVLVSHQNLCPDDAAMLAAQMHDTEVRDVERLEAEIAAAGLGDEVLRYVGCVKAWIRGHLDWGVQTGRYGTLPVGLAA